MAISTKPPSGTRDFLPADVLARRAVIDAIRGAYERHGFAPLETPALERLDVLTGKYGDEGDQLMFKVLKRGEKLPELGPDTSPDDLVDLALRYDLTVPLARVVAQHSGTLPRYFKRYQIQPVWRADRPQRGRFREFFQCDVDFVGATSLIAEATVITAVTDALAALDFRDVVIHINDRRILAGMMEAAGVPPELEPQTLVAIDKLDKIGLDGVRAELSTAGVTDAAIAGLESLVLSADVTLEHLADAFASRDVAVGTAGAAALTELFALLEAAPLRAGTVRFDPSLARGLSYYTGPIFEIRVDGLAGSIGGGGRYDGLVGMFRGQDIPAVGFSLGLERILVVMQERGMLSAEGLAPDLYVALMDTAGAGACLALASRAREAGLRAEVHPETGKLGKQFAYAESLGARFVALLGETERADGVVSLKDLVSGEQQTMAPDALIAHVLGARDAVPEA